MNSLEALSRVLAHAEGNLQIMRDRVVDPDYSGDLSPEFHKTREDLEVAVAVCQAIMNTALPIARFRAHVEITPVVGEKGHRREFTVCAVDIPGIQAGLVGVRGYTGNVLATLWEQKQGGADMLSGHHGYCKGPLFSRWVKSLSELQEGQMVQ